MTALLTSPDPLLDASPAAPQSAWRIAAQKLFSKPRNIVFLTILALYILIGLASFTPFFAHKAVESVGDSYAPPSWGTLALLFGTDIQGQSVFWRVLFGTRIALTIATAATLMETTLGLLFGVAAGYFGGWVDSLIIWLFTTLNTIPWILLVIAMTYALKGRAFSFVFHGRTYIYELSDLTIVILALGLTGWTGLCRVIRAEVLRVRDLDYITASRALGIGTPRILFKHIVPQTIHLVVINATLASAGYIQAEVVLSFLGLGITRDPSWGRMIDDAKLELLRGVWWQLIAATSAIFILSLIMNFLGDALRDALDPRLTGVQ